VAQEADDVTAVFIHIPRTGGMSISKALQVTKYRNRHRLVKGAEYSGIVTFGHEFLPYLRRHRLAPPEAFTFAFCRNPFERAVSLWAFNNRRNGYELSFREFCLTLGNWGWRIRSPQARWVDGVDLDFLGRFETLQEDFERLCALLGVERTKALPHLNQTEHAPWAALYDDETRGIVRRHYARDFEQFEYADDHIPDR